ncbi:hypothetical protein JQ596_19965 [Bradyrhizobium manausense]|uniref:hypothetical protein n=1 Tax=Bradyrhizobium TaxID=374 RepID=UPI001BA64E5C|nr:MULTISPECIES: hypothetical protein [Bradyrhizobium]MBR0827811.1 hypothetical protein [Bradyrhizobium manausense]UVO26281.1 hypothetical protein KUF59_27425 [Bradyrhizobium arachidis]
MKTAQASTPVTKRSGRNKHRRLVAAVLAALLVGTICYGVSIWRATPPLTLQGNIIMGVAAILVLVAGCGLITLMFYSYRRGYDESARSNRPSQE